MHNNYFKKVNYANPYKFLKIYLMRIYLFEKNFKKTFYHSKNLNGFKDLYKSIRACHVWSGQRHQKSHAARRLIATYNVSSSSESIKS